ncbi:hypothetical protein [Streptomyces griseosporeus]|uniref:hypothetical protein n=1 Tax=Streptomyces griseosporeus TaxID=1910 RepID=UPI0036F99CA8
MTWTVDETRVRPFLSAAERRDVVGTLWGSPQSGRAFPAPGGTGTDAGDTAPEGRKRWKDRKDTKDGKDGKEGKETKDGKDTKDGKETKDTKDYKDTKDSKDGKDGKDGKETKDYKDYKDGKDSKDTKDGKDGKDFKDGFDGAMTPPGVTAFVRQSADPAESAGAVPLGMAQQGNALVEPLTDEEEIAAELRASRISRLLRRRGVVI